MIMIAIILSSGALVMHTNSFLARTPIAVEAMRVSRFQGHPEVRR